MTDKNCEYKISFRQAAGLGMRRGRGRRLAAAGAIMFAAAAASTVIAATAWSAERIAHLFPAPLEGWTAEDIVLEERDTITSGFESFAGATLAETTTAGVSIRLTAKRLYSYYEKDILVTIDTEDIDGAATVDVVTAAFETDVITRKKLERDGVSIVEHDNIAGISMKSGNEAARAFNIGSAGVVSLECSYAGCGADLDLMLERMDFGAVTQFIAYDHRR